MDDALNDEGPLASSGTGRGKLNRPLGIANLLGRGTVEPEHDGEDEDDEEPPPPVLVPHGAPMGCLTVHVKNCKDFNKSSTIKKGTQGFLRLTLGGKVKCTKLYSYNDPKAGHSKFPICFNEWKYFSIRIPKNVDHSLGICESNRLAMELIFFEQGTGVPKLIGKTYVKLLDIFNRTTVSHQVELRLKRQTVCKVDTEMVITYGSLGYGYSHQLKHPKKNMEMLVERSLFLRCPPPEDRKDSHFNVITPKPLPYVDLIGALLHRENTGSAHRGSSCPAISPLVLELLERRGRLMQMHETMEAFESSEDAVQFLEKQVMKKGIQTSNPWRTNKRFKVLSKWRRKASMIPELLNFGGSVASAKQKSQTPPTVTGETSSALLTNRLLSQKDTSSANQNEVQDRRPPTEVAERSGTTPPPAQSSAVTSSKAEPSDQSAAALTLAQQTVPVGNTPAESAVAQKLAPPSSVAPSPRPPDFHPGQAAPPAPPKHVPQVLSEGQAQPPTHHTPVPANVTSVPIHHTSPRPLPALEEEEEEEVSSLLKRLSSLTVTSDPRGDPTPVPTQGQEAYQPRARHHRDQSGPEEPRGESASGRRSDTGGSGRAVEPGPTQRDTAGQSSPGVEVLSGRGSVSSGGRREDERTPPPAPDVPPSQLAGAWTESRTTAPGPVGSPERRSAGSPAAFGPGPALRPLVPPPPSNPPSPSPLTRSPLPPLDPRATPSPDLETLILEAPPWTGGSIPPPRGPGQGGAGLPDPGLVTSSASNNHPPSLSAWLSTDSLTGTASGSGPWFLLSEIEVAALRSGLVFSPLTPISTGPAGPDCASPGRTSSAGKPGKERPRILNTRHHPYPYQRPSRARDHYRKM